LDEVLLVGPGMHRLMLTGSPPVATRDTQRWSRSLHAMGPATWRRLVGLRIAVVGCGRTGSLIAGTLARLGVRGLVLIDPDQVELHNLGEMDGVTEADLGRNKAEALAASLRQTACSSGGHQEIAAVPASILTTPEALLDADVIFSCVDNDAARLACALTATTTHKVLVDVGTGIHDAPSPLRPVTRSPLQPTMGADVRLILPGDGCLLCCGGVADYDWAVQSLLRRNQDDERGGGLAWWEERRGSLRSLNMIAAGMAVQLLTDLVAGQLDRTTWLQVDWSAPEDTTVRTLRPVADQDRDCPLCLRSGIGRT
jgi:hypothetical protein